MKTELQIKQRAFLEETCAHFNSSNRSIDASGKRCIYGGVGCAIGRRIADKELCERLDNTKVSGVGRNVIFTQLPAELRELEQEFLSAVQLLHDADSDWCESGLSTSGKMFKDEIISKFNLF